MGELEIKVLELLNRECAIDYITRELKIKDEYLADIIIILEDKGYIVLSDKKWGITEKGKEIFDKRDKLLKKLKVEYLYGEIDSREEYDMRRKELEDISQIISSTDGMIEDEHEKEDEIVNTEIIRPEIISSQDIQGSEQNSETLNSNVIRDDSPKELPDVEPVKKICPKCRVDNKPESNYCRKCGTVL